MKKQIFTLSLFFCFIFVKAQIQSISYDIETLTPPKKTLPLISSSQIMAKLGITKYEKNSIQQDSLVFFHEHPFLQGLAAAYKEHRPFVISPDMIWLLINQGFAHHINNNSEVFRDKIVDFKGKQKLTIVNNTIRLGDPNSDWESLFPQFERGISLCTKGNLVENLTANFTTTTPTSKIASQITIMESVKAYFDYEVILVGCGLPKITIEGSPEDWEKVLAKTAFIAQYDLEWWTSEINPILEKIIKASKGKFNKKFWMNMVKIHSPKKYGQREKIDGWIIKFFPFDDKGKRRPLKPIADVNSLASEIVKIPFILKEENTHLEYKMEFWAGFMGLSQQSDFTLKPQIAWAVTHKVNVEKIPYTDLDPKETRSYLSMKNVDEDALDTVVKFESIGTLDLIFSDEIIITEELMKIKITNLYLYGKITPEVEQSIRKRFPRRFIAINGKLE